MKQRSKVIATSIATIAMCASLAVGGTFALFTSESEVNIAVTSGTVDVKAYADKATLSYTSSLGETLTESSATIVENVVKIDKIVPGDTIEFDLVIENHSNVTVQYQTVLSLVDGVDLFTGLQIEVDQKVYDGMTAYSNWTELSPIDVENKEFDRIPVTITLPESAGDEYQNKTAEISFIVKAVQGNAAVEQPASDENTLYVYSENDMKLFANSVNKGNNFSGKTVMLMSDIDLNNEVWTPIGNSANKFQGTFDGNGKTVSNLYAVKDSGYIGLFGYTSDGEVKNLNVHNATVQGSVCGVVAASPYTSDYTNIKLTGDIKVDGKYYTGGLVGRNAYGDIKNITINANAGSYVKADSVEDGTAYRTYVGGVIGFKGEGASVTENVVSNIDVIGTVCDIGGVTGIAHYGNIFRNCVSTGTVTNLSTDTEEREIGGIAGVWNNGGADVVFENCEFKGELVSCSDLSNTHNNLVVAAYGSGSGKLVIDGRIYQLIVNGMAQVTEADETTYYEVFNANGMKYLAKSVNEDGKTYVNETVKLTADIDLENEAWTPIGKDGDQQNGKAFYGTFDGNDKTISNLYINLSTRAYQAAGLFGSIRGGTIKNLKIENANVYALDETGATDNGIAVVVGCAPYGATIDNVDVTNAVVNGNRKAAIISGYFAGTIKNCDVVNAEITIVPDLLANGTYDNGDKVGGIVAYINTIEGANASNYNTEITNNTVTNAKLKAYRDIGGIIGGGYPAPDKVTGNKAENISIVVDQVTGSYGAKAANADYIVGRNLSNADLTNNTVSGTNNIAYTKAVSPEEKLESAFSNSQDTAFDLILSNGNYAMPNGSESVNLQGKTLTITGTKDTVIDVSNVDTRDQFVTGANIVFDGVTLNFSDGSGNIYMGFANTTNLTYKNCHITGLQFLYGENVTFENCVIDSSSNTGEPHSVWSYGAKNVNFIGCEFIYGNRALNLYKDQDIDGGKQVVNFTNCKFTTTATDSKGAVEINSSAFSIGIEVNMTGCTAPAYGDMVYVSEWDDTEGVKTTVYVNGVEYSAPVHKKQNA
ncbi:MAG: DUF3737 family protein [Clostridia bacterium]|nr:DUF3737 family protein [Clostridia bacterium]